MTANQQFLGRDILIDGREFFNTEFIRCRIVYRGTAPVQFENCIFRECQWVFDGPAANTLVFLSALATQLGPEAAAMVKNLLEGIENGEIENILTQTRPPVAV